MRPRANTISHVDNATHGMIEAANYSVARHDVLGFGYHHHSSSHGLPGPGSYEFRGMSTASGNHGNFHGLPKLETNGLNVDISASLRTAPPYGGFGTDVDMDNLMFGPGSTINPAQLHFNDSPQSLAFETPTSPFHQGFPAAPGTRSMMDNNDNPTWLNGFENHLSYNHANEQAIDGSSPSAISTGSPSAISEVMLDGSNNAVHTSSMWQNPIISHAPLPSTYPMDFSGSTIPEFFAPGPVSPKSLQGQLGGADRYFSTPPPLTAQSPMPVITEMANQYFHPPMVAKSDTPSNSAGSVSSSNYQSSVTSNATDCITDAARQTLLSSLSQPSVFGHSHLASQPTASSPLSSGFAAKPQGVNGVCLPSTFDLQRYVASYIQYCHPHLPFLHIPTLSFDSPAYASNLRSSSGYTSFGQSGIAGGGGCLMLAMAAIGALYVFEQPASKDLFELAKKMIQICLEERRKADMSAALKGTSNIDKAPQNTPIWLVQAMLLNVIYGHNSGDKISADIASTHCAALVSLARAADLAQSFPCKPSRNGSFPYSNHCSAGDDVQMEDDNINNGRWGIAGEPNIPEDQSEWLNWKLAEERKRTVFVVYILSSLLVSAYNHAPALMNSEIRLDLPCDEDLWAADSADVWYAMGGAALAEQKAIPFASALSSLLTASQRQPQMQHHNSLSYHQSLGSGLDVDGHVESEFQPSTFGCLILINALHNYIWETRQRHIGRQWTTRETEAMHAHIEPALKAWQVAWASHPQHSLERPNPFGLGPLSADSIPLLDLAYVRLFVNLGRSKEAFWQRDFDGMADELARGAEMVQHAGYSPDSSPTIDHSIPTLTGANGNSPDVDADYIKVECSEPTISVDNVQQPGQCSKRERHLRKASFYAANSLSMSDKLGVTFADFNSRELPIQSAMCAFDCAQVLAEWISTVQERVGRYLGILGEDDIDYGQVPGIMLLDDEDCKLLEKINEILNSAEVKMTIDNGNLSAMAALTTSNGSSYVEGGGYGSKILMITAHMLEKSAVWPGESDSYTTQVMANA